MTAQPDSSTEPTPVEADGTVDFFGVRSRLKDGRQLIAETRGSELAPLSYDNRNVTGFVLSTVLNAVIAAPSRKPAYVDVDPVDAAILYLDGQIELDKIKQAVVAANEIAIPKVLLVGHTVELIVHRQLGRAVAVRDEHGEKIYGSTRLNYR